MRTPDDTYTRRTAHWVGRTLAKALRREVDKALVAHENRKAVRRRHRRGLIEILTLDAEAQRAQSEGLCGSANTEDGHACRNPRMIGERWCYIHGGRNRIA